MQQQIPLPISSGDKSSFENFWVGHNSEAVSAIRSCVETGEPKVLYLYGPEGAGKSHLVYAAMRLAKEEVLNSTYLSLANPQLGDPEKAAVLLEMVDVAHLVCVDDLQCWAGDRMRETALFALFEQIRHGGGQLLAVGQRSPDRLGVELRDLVSRLGSGLVYPIKPLTDEQRFEALKLRAKARGLKIEDDVVRYLLSRTPRSSTELFDLLDSIDQASLVEKRRITIPFLQRFLKSNGAIR